MRPGGCYDPPAPRSHAGTDDRPTGNPGGLQVPPGRPGHGSLSPRRTAPRPPPVHRPAPPRGRSGTAPGPAGRPRGRTSRGRGRGPGRHPRVVTRDVVTRLLGQGPGGAGGCATPTAPLAVGFLMKALFRQLNVLGRIDDSLADGLAALTVDGHASWSTGSPGWHRPTWPSERRGRSTGLRPGPTVAAALPVWLPAPAEERCGPRCRRRGVGLQWPESPAIGSPATDRASVGIVELRSGYRRPGHAADLHFCALVETLRTGVPPLVVATYYSRDGELDVEPVDGELLLAAARRTAAALRVLHGPATGRSRSDGRSPDRDIAGTRGTTLDPRALVEVTRPRPPGPSPTTQRAAVRERLVPALPQALGGAVPGGQLPSTWPSSDGPRPETATPSRRPTSPSRGGRRSSAGHSVWPPSTPASTVGSPHHRGHPGGGRRGRRRLGPVGLADVPLGGVVLGPAHGGQGLGGGRGRSTWATSLWSLLDWVAFPTRPTVGGPGDRWTFSGPRPLRLDGRSELQVDIATGRSGRPARGPRPPAGARLGGRGHPVRRLAHRAARGSWPWWPACAAVPSPCRPGSSACGPSPGTPRSPGGPGRSTPPSTASSHGRGRVRTTDRSGRPPGGHVDDVSGTGPGAAPSGPLPTWRGGRLATDTIIVIVVSARLDPSWSVLASPSTPAATVASTSSSGPTERSDSRSSGVTRIEVRGRPSPTTRPGNTRRRPTRCRLPRRRSPGCRGTRRDSLTPGRETGRRV